jgi:formylglycine-generating enzyme required for sulfatase activity
MAAGRDELTPERWERVQELLERASELEPENRAAFVLREAGGDAALVAEVLRLLTARPRADYLAPPEAERRPTSKRLGDFELEEELGRGRFGVVYRARQVSLGGRAVAVKVLPPSLMLTPRDVDRFRRESNSAARLRHPNIVSILTVGEEQGTSYFAMDLIRGSTLERELRRLRDEHGHVDDDGGAHLPDSRAGTYFRAVAETVRQVADGLAYAHAHGVVHRDVKPANLMLDGEGRALIVDFGLARDDEQGTITKSDVVAGTPHYMSPEQASGHFHRVDQRTDVYSLGVVLFELLTLRVPFEGASTHEILRNIRERAAPRIRRLNQRVPRDLEVICTTAMARELGRRYASAAELRDDLARFLEHQAIRARPPSALEQLGRAAVRQRVPLVALGLALLALIVGAFLARAQSERERRAALLAVLDSAAAEGPLRSLPLARLLELRRALEELGGESGVRAAELGDRVRGVERELDALRAELVGRGREALARAREPELPAAAREQERLGGLFTLLEARHLFPEDETLRELARAESAFPTLTVRARDEQGTPLPAEVWLRPVELATSAVGERRALGRTPLAPTPVAPGYYRVVVTFDAGGFRELIVDLGPATMQVEVQATRRADEATLTRDMTAIEGGAFVFPEYPGERCFQGREVELQDFLLDTYEVTNAAYVAFARATGRELPLYFDLVPEVEAFLATHGEHPVVGLTWNESVDYAEWAGKRLPTAAEWFRAACGREGRPFPYSADPAAEPRGNVRAEFTLTTSHEAQWRNYLAHAAPVRAHPESASPEGVLQLFGNVYEVTESMAVTRTGPNAVLLPRSFDRFFFGAAWNALTRGFGPTTPGIKSLGPLYRNEYTGLRCAKSARP